MKAILLFISAFVPLYFLIFVKFVVGIIVKTIYFTPLTITTLIFYFCLIILGCFGLVWNMQTNKGKIEKIKIEEFTNITDQHFLSYFSLFVLFALGFQLTMPSMLIISILIFIFIGIVYVNNKMFYINPLLNILGYNFFEISYTTPKSDRVLKTKVYFKGNLEEGVFKANFKNKNFSFLEK